MVVVPRVGTLMPTVIGLFSPKFDGVSDFSDGLAAVNVGAQRGMGGKWGYISKTGGVVIAPRFLVAGHFHNGRACAMEETHKDALIDKTGNLNRLDDTEKFRLTTAP